MSIVDFLPIPEIKRGYKTKDNKVIVVRDLIKVRDNKVVIVEELSSGRQFEWNVTEWNEIIDSAISEAIQFEYDYDRVFKTPQDLIQAELGKIQSKRKEGKELKGKYGKLNEFLWSFAGVDKDLLRMCPTDHARMAGHGSAILGTSFLSALSFVYGAYLFTDSLLISLFVGVISFCMTVFLDGFITNTMYCDGENTISKRELVSSIPRIILSIIIGIVIAVPFQIKIFEDKINDYILTEHHNSVVTSSVYISNKEQSEALEQEIQKLKTTINHQEKEYAEEVSTSTKKAGYGSIAKELSLRIDSSKKMLLEESRKLSQLNATRDSLINIANHLYKKDFTFTSRIEALSKIASFKNNESKILPIANLLICIMWILIFMLPIINKILMADGAYDKLLKLEEHLTEKMTRIHIEELEKRIK